VDMTLIIDLKPKMHLNVSVQVLFLMNLLDKQFYRENTSCFIGETLKNCPKRLNMIKFYWLKLQPPEERYERKNQISNL